MDYKWTEATLNRPEGNRVIDAPIVLIKIPETIRQLKGEGSWRKNDRNGITVLKTANTTMVLVSLHAKAVLKHNLVDGIFTIQVIEGIVRVTTPDDTVDMLAGHIIAFHQLVDHSVEALADSVLLLTNNLSS